LTRKIPLVLYNLLFTAHVSGPYHLSVQSVKTNRKLTLLFFSLWLVFSGCVHSIKALPEGIDYRSKGYCVGAGDIEFLVDLTYKNTVGKTVHEQEIFDTIFTLIDNAHNYILIDMFLFNSYQGTSGLLRIVKTGTTFRFWVRLTGADTWQDLGSVLTTAKDSLYRIGMIAKTWSHAPVEVTFSDFTILPGGWR